MSPAAFAFTTPETIQVESVILILRISRKQSRPRQEAVSTFCFIFTYFISFDLPIGDNPESDWNLEVNEIYYYTRLKLEFLPLNLVLVTHNNL